MMLACVLAVGANSGEGWPALGSIGLSECNYLEASLMLLTLVVKPRNVGFVVPDAGDRHSRAPRLELDHVTWPQWFIRHYGPL
jgi:hypothetical protein